MKYKAHSLIKSYAQEASAEAARKLRHAPARLARLADSIWNALALYWYESLLRRYFLCLGTDLLRYTHRLRPRGYLAFALAVCALMSFGFLVINPPALKFSHQVRVDLSRPVLTSLTRKEPGRLQGISPYQLASLYEAGTGKAAQGWYSSGELSYTEALRSASATDLSAQAGSEEPPGTLNGAKAVGSSWRSPGSLLGIESGQVIMYTALGGKCIPSLGQIRQSPNLTARSGHKLAAYGSGEASPEELLAELSLQNAGNASWSGFAAEPPSQPDWRALNYGTAIFDAAARHWSGAKLPDTSGARICRQDRTELASWLNLLYAGQSRKNIYMVRQAAHYRSYVELYAGQYSLPPSLVYAIMRVESGFNPLAISKANALGLMQVVPNTAGNEVHAFLNGKKASPKPELLFRPEKNILYGTTYLHLLMTKHFQEVRNPLSRELCSIAAYNGGPRAVYRVFNGDRQRAVQQINRLTPEQLYAKLLKELYSLETREYLPKVLAARNDFLRGQARMK